MPGCCAYGCSNKSENGFILKVFPKDKLRCLVGIKSKKEQVEANKQFLSLRSKYIYFQPILKRRQLKILA